MAKTVSWMWGGKKHYGTLIRETKTHKFARTKNGKVKKIQDLQEQVLAVITNQRELQVTLQNHISWLRKKVAR